MFSCCSTRVTLNLVFVRYLPHLFRYEEISYHILLLIILGFRFTSTRIGHRPASSNNSNNEKKVSTNKPPIWLVAHRKVTEEKTKSCKSNEGMRRFGCMGAINPQPSLVECATLQWQCHWAAGIRLVKIQGVHKVRVHFKCTWSAKCTRTLWTPCIMSCTVTFWFCSLAYHANYSSEGTVLLARAKYDV